MGTDETKRSGLYRKADFDLYRFGSSESLIYSRRENQAAFLPQVSADLLSVCNEFLTLEAHATNACRVLKIDPANAGAVRAELESLAEQGLLVDFADRIAPFGRSGTGSAPELGSLCVISRNRVESAQRALESAKDHSDERRPRTWIVFDDSPEATTRKRYREMLGAFKAPEGIEVRYAGREEKQSYAREISRRTGADPRLIEFALLDPFGTGFTPGANRNCALLDCAGETYLSIDDDVVCELHDLPRSETTVSVARDSGLRLEYYANPDEARAALKPSRQSWWARNQAMLGRRFSEVAAEGAALCPGPGAHETLEGLRAATSRIRLSWTGIAGDSGSMEDRLMSLLHRGVDIGDATSVVRACSQLSLARNRFFMGAAAGLDARDLLPPFTPIFRGEDNHFGRLFFHCFPNDLVAYLPGALLHLASPESGQGRRASLTRFMFPTIVDEIAKRAGKSAQTDSELLPEQRLARIGKAFETVAALELPEFEAEIRTILYRIDSTVMDRLEKFPLGTIPAIDAYRDSVRERVLSESYAIPVELSHLEPGQGISTFRSQLGLLGELYRSWPEIWRGARDQRLQGLRISNPLTDVSTER